MINLVMMATNINPKFHHLQKYRSICLAAIAFLLVLLTIIPLRLAIALQQAPAPQAMLMLGGGDGERETFTAEFARQHPTLEIWISSGIHSDRVLKIFQAAGVPNSQLHIDCRAVDTVTNFTSLVSDFKARNLHHFYLITADFHMTRAKLIATFVLGSQEIIVTPVLIRHQKIDVLRNPESWHHNLRDVIRAILWLLTGRTGASLKSASIISCL